MGGLVFWFDDFKDYEFPCEDNSAEESAQMRHVCCWGDLDDAYSYIEQVPYEDYPWPQDAEAVEAENDVEAENTHNCSAGADCRSAVIDDMDDRGCQAYEEISENVVGIAHPAADVLAEYPEDYEIRDNVHKVCVQPEVAYYRSERPVLQDQAG